MSHQGMSDTAKVAISLALLILLATTVSLEMDSTAQRHLALQAQEITSLQDQVATDGWIRPLMPMTGRCARRVASRPSAL